MQLRASLLTTSGSLGASHFASKGDDLLGEWVLLDYIYICIYTFKVAVEDHEDSMFHLFHLAVCYQASRTRHASFPLLKQAYFRLTYAIWLGEL